MIERGSPTGLPRWLALWLVGLMLAVSAAPCSGLAAPRLDRPTLAAPADPCRSHAPAPAQVCAQIACQAMIAPCQAAAFLAPLAATAPYRLAVALRAGLHEPPPLPPPRPPMS